MALKQINLLCQKSKIQKENIMSNINCTGKIIAKKFELLNSNNDNSCISFLNSSNSPAMGQP